MIGGDCMQRVLLEDVNARGVVVHLEDVTRQVIDRNPYPPEVTRQLAEGLVVAALCSSGIKYSGRISLQLRSNGPVRLLMADCTEDGGLRGIVRLDDDDRSDELPSDLSELARDGVLSFTLEPREQGRVWQGMVPLEGADMAAAVTAYFERSEQLPTRLCVAVEGRRAAGLLVQRMPGPCADADGWTRMQHVMDTVGSDELLHSTGEQLLHRLFHAERRRLYPASSLRFHCPCSRERVETVLKNLGKDELEALLAEEETIRVECEFCRNGYRFDRMDVAGLLRGVDIQEPAPDRSIH